MAGDDRLESGQGDDMLRSLAGIRDTAVYHDAGARIDDGDARPDFAITLHAPNQITAADIVL